MHVESDIEKRGKYILKGKIAKVISFTFNFILLVCPPSKKEKEKEIEE